MAEVEAPAGSESAANVLAAARVDGVYAALDGLGRQTELRGAGGSGPDIVRWTYADADDYTGAVTFIKVVP